MRSKYRKVNRKAESYIASIDTFIERLKKIRALNCDPSDVGIDNFVLRRITLYGRGTTAPRSW